MATKKTAVSTPEPEDKDLGTIAVPQLAIARAVVHCVGTSRLVVNQFANKGGVITPGGGLGPLPGPIRPRDPEAQYLAAMYLDDEARCCVRAISFKKAVVESARLYGKSVTMAGLRTVFFVLGDLLPIQGEPRMREDIVRTSGIKPQPMPRYRPEFFPWAVDVPVEYFPGVIPLKSLLQLFGTAGKAVGICENRPGKSGDNWGCWKVAGYTEMEVPA